MTTTITDIIDHDRRIAEVRIAGRAIADYHCGLLRSHPHRIDDLVGYVLRVVTYDGVTLHRHDGPSGFDIEWVGRAEDYARALEAARWWTDSGLVATIDRLYRCGCRSGR